MASYSTRHYVKEYAGNWHVFDISFRGTRTRTPLIVYTTTYGGHYNGYQGGYATVTTANLAWMHNFLGTYTKSYSGAVNYQSFDSATYTKAYAGDTAFAGTGHFEKSWVPTEQDFTTTYDKDYTKISVSYTHLTLPTKA